MDQDADRGVDHRRRVKAGRRERVGDDHAPRPGDSQTMGERPRGKMRVEQRHDHADARKPKPDGGVIGAIAHDQGDHIALLQFIV